MVEKPKLKAFLKVKKGYKKYINTITFLIFERLFVLKLLTGITIIFSLFILKLKKNRC